MALLVPASKESAGAGHPHEATPGPVSTGGSPLRFLLLAAAVAVGILLIALSFRLGAEGKSSWLYATLFWVGLLVAVLPSAARLVSSSAVRSERLFALLMVGAATAAPRYLRSPAGPLFTDEYATWRQTLDFTAGTSWHVPGGLVPGVEGFPGLQALVGAVSAISGLSVWHGALLVLLLAHLVASFAVFVLAETVLGRVRVGAAAALIYAVNPTYLYVETRLAPASLAVALCLVALALAVRATRTADRPVRVGFAVVAGCALVLSAFTDGVVTLMTGAILLAVAVAATLRAREHGTQVAVPTARAANRQPVMLAEHPAVWWSLVGVLAAAAAVVFGALQLTSGSFDQTTDWFPSRSLLQMPGTSPLVEVLLAVVAPLLMLLFAALGLWKLWSQPRQRSGRLLALASIGVLYFPLVPVALLPSVAPTVRSAWALTYVGVALLVAPVVLRRLEAARHRQLWTIDRTAAVPVGAVALAGVLIGNSAAAAGAGYRYSGPVRYGAEGRTDSAELRGVAEAFAADNGRVGILTDRYTGPEFAAYSGSRLAHPTTVLPGYQLLGGNDPSAAWVIGMVQSGFTDLIVDVRMAGVEPVDGDSFGPGDPAEGRPARETALRRLDRVPWASRVVASQHYRVYRLDWAGAGRSLVHQADAWGPNYAPLPGTGSKAPQGGGSNPLPASTAYPPPASANAAGAAPRTPFYFPPGGAGGPATAGSLVASGPVVSAAPRLVFGPPLPAYRAAPRLVYGPPLPGNRAAPGHGPVATTARPSGATASGHTDGTTHTAGPGNSGGSGPPTGGTSHPAEPGNTGGSGHPTGGTSHPAEPGNTGGSGHSGGSDNHTPPGHSGGSDNHTPPGHTGSSDHGNSGGSDNHTPPGHTGSSDHSTKPGKATGSGHHTGSSDDKSGHSKPAKSKKPNKGKAATSTHSDRPGKAPAPERGKPAKSDKHDESKHASNSGSAHQQQPAARPQARSGSGQGGPQQPNSGGHMQEMATMPSDTGVKRSQQHPGKQVASTGPGPDQADRVRNASKA